MGRVVLLAEDEYLLARLLGDVLEAEGFEVILAADGVEALGRARHRHVDVLLTDLDMPRLGGWELVGRLRGDRPGLPVVVMTGRPPCETGRGGAPGGGGVAAVARGGPFALLPKPFAPERLVETLRGVLAAASVPADAGAARPPQAWRAASAARVG